MELCLCNVHEAKFESTVLLCTLGECAQQSPDCFQRRRSSNIGRLIAVVNFSCHISATDLRVLGVARVAQDPAAPDTCTLFVLLGLFAADNLSDVLEDIVHLLCHCLLG